MIETTRRGFVTGLITLIAAPAIVRAASIMPVKALPPDLLDIPTAVNWNAEYAAQFTLEHFLQAKQMLDDAGVPDYDRIVYVSEADYNRLFAGSGIRRGELVPLPSR